jgi:hypothetical protein
MRIRVGWRGQYSFEWKTPGLDVLSMILRENKMSVLHLSDLLS